MEKKTLVNTQGLGDTVGERIRSYRRKMKIDQKDLAKRIGVSQGTITRYETGTINTTLETLTRIAEALRVKVSDLLPNEEAPKTDPWIEDPEISWYGSCLKAGERALLTEKDAEKIRDLHRTMVQIANQVIKSDKGN